MPPPDPGGSGRALETRAAVKGTGEAASTLTRASQGPRAVVGVGDAEDGGGLGGAERVAGRPEPEVALEPADGPRRGAGRRAEVHAEAAPDPRWR